MRTILFAAALPTISLLQPVRLVAASARFHQAHFASMSASPQSSPKPASFYDCVVKMPGGKELSMADYRGKVVLVVNTASACGFTPQYTALQHLYSKYKDQGLVIIGQPSNEFGGQNPEGDDGEKGTAALCQRNYGVDFPIAAKGTVNGSGAVPLFAFLKSQKKSLALERIKWNFEKFLIRKDGEVAARYTSITKPESLEPEIIKLLAE
ncbi:uncharacterized protein L969DRAFT_44055 [Mixia osmundae IAM 14324]|uniref:Glutathione peroxidase n=1 Tax=Mixia osmundae (strain CBS 9802 / IAM 14324 / JCM 22182 / KY 12970) TaxID=764103 RepID=G7E857_MIXOS|nr:uncharacterized protein L969DRAFT_44055 [Mixia osmundae IAM 14324]KEI42391.1 hypothetical protein L969DRAFT_44055 [Mixia osmundae IAM 14324]GAA99017.1 hypothetical protein E5Q_05706 [Mixia osmundae IAM 14324]